MILINSVVINYNQIYEYYSVYVCLNKELSRLNKSSK